MKHELKKQIDLHTAFDDYILDCVLGEGGAGRVYGGRTAGGELVAVKVLTQAARDKRQRFKNEVGFLSRTRHPNLVAVTDYGLADVGKLKGPFYVMPQYASSLRTIMDGRVGPERVLSLFGQVLDGVEVAHLHGVTHRDIKPENILVKEDGESLAVADFGVADFTADQLLTLVETDPTQRLANFAYAAPEQRVPGRQVSAAADIYALGLILNEMFTGAMPHGTSYRQVGDVERDYAFLDPLIARMIAQSPDQRPATVQSIKLHIQKYRDEAVSLQRLSELRKAVVPTDEIDDPLATEPPILVSATWGEGQLTLDVDRDLSEGWIQTLKYGLGSFGAVLGHGPETFNFKGQGKRQATAAASARDAQAVIDHFKNWLPKATRQYRYKLEQERERLKRERQRRLEAEREAEEQRLTVNSQLQI